MKRTLFLLLLCAQGALSLFAQDKIITREGETITGYGTEVGPSTIYYRAESAETSPTLKIAKNLVLMVKFQSGEKVMISEEGASSSSAATSITSTAASTSAAMRKDIAISDEDNAAIMARYTPDVTYMGEKSEKEASKAVFLFNFTKDSHVADKNVEIGYKQGIVLPDGRWISQFCNEDNKITNKIAAPAFEEYSARACMVTIKNKTNKTIYVDLANTFFFRSSNAVAYYVPTATTNTSTSSTGVGVNMGAVANALGVGGSVGKLANGVTVGGEHGNTASTTVFSQRVVPIAPMSTIELQAVKLFPEEFTDTYNFGNNKRFIASAASALTVAKLRIPSSGVKVGERVDYDEQASPITVGSLVTYAMTEDIAVPYTILSKLYAYAQIGSKSLKLINFSETVRQAFCIGATVQK